MTTPWIVYATALLLLATLLTRAISRRPRQLNLPPGPKPWPIIGNFNLIGSLPHRSIDALSKIYGPIMQLQFGSRPVVIASSAEMAREFLKTHDLNLASRPNHIAAGKHIFFDNLDILWSPYGPNWRLFRKLCATELFSPKSIDSYKYIRVEELNSMISHIFDAAEKPIVLKQYLFTLSLNVITRMVMMKKYVDEAPGSIMEPKEFVKLVTEMGLLAGMNSMGDYIPLIHSLDLQGIVKRMKAVRKKMDKFLEQVLDEHQARRAGLQASMGNECMVDVLLQLSNENNNEKLSRTHVKAFIVEVIRFEAGHETIINLFTSPGFSAMSQDMIMGGTETSTATMEWAFVELLRYPKTMVRALEELDKVIGNDRWVEENDLPQLPYIEAILKEVMRMHPGAPLLEPHLCRQDCKIAGYDIPANTIALVNVWTIGKDPKSWDMPDEFQPDRFIGKSIDVRGQDFELLPFGSGRRMCPASNLSLKVLQLSLANLIHGFVWGLPENMSIKELKMEEIFGLMVGKKEPLVVVVRPRLPAHLYSL